MNWCKLFGHKWQSYQQKVRVDTHAFVADSSGRHLILNAMINTEFRYCDKCSTNQIRTNSILNTWKDYELTVEQSRVKKLKELGI
jgi:hypothetical protein